MPGSYAPAIELADSALAALKIAYDKRTSSDIGELILSAQGYITRLKQATLRTHSLKYDVYELPDNNSRFSHQSHPSAQDGVPVLRCEQKPATTDRRAL